MADREVMCWRCHMLWHSRFSDPVAVAAYFKQVAEGVRFPAVHKHDFSILNREHGLRRRRAS